MAQLDGAAEYTDFFSSEGYDSPEECPEYMTLNNLMVRLPLYLELWGMWSTHSLPLFPGPLWLGVVSLDSVLTLAQIKLDSVITLNGIVGNRTVLTFNCV